MKNDPKEKDADSGAAEIVPEEDHRDVGEETASMNC
jgi:hypothetical protein